MVRLWWLWWPQPARPPPQRWRQAAEHREAPRGVTPPQPDTTWQDPEVLRGFRGALPAVVVDPPPMAAPRQRQRLEMAVRQRLKMVERMVMLRSAVMLHVGVEGGRWPENDAGDQMRGRTR
ncbi:hypothetical protein Tco_1418577 [Tanacetum coccineum]